MSDPNVMKDILGLLKKAKTQPRSVPIPDGINLSDRIRPVTPREPTGMNTPLETIEVQTVLDSTHEHLGHIVVLDDDLCIAYLPDGFVIDKVNQTLLRQAIRQGQRKISIQQVASVVVRTEKQHTCVWFTPEAVMIEAGCEPAASYDFDRPNTYGVCTSPDVRRSTGYAAPKCDYSGKMGLCKEYNAQSWTRVRDTMVVSPDGGSYRFVIEASRRGLGAPARRIVRFKDGSDIPVQLSQLDAYEHTDLDDVVELHWTTHILEIQGTEVEQVEIIATEDSTSTKEKFFEYVRQN